MYKKKLAICKDSYLHHQMEKGRAIPLPHSLIFELTQRCNLSCKPCWYRLNKTEQGIKELSLQEIQSLFKEKLSPYKIQTCYLIGSEPFMREALPEVVKIIAGQGIKTSLQTNGTLATKENLESLKPYLSRIDTSLDGLETTNDNIRGKGTFQKIIQMLKLLCNRCCKMRPRRRYAF